MCSRQNRNATSAVNSTAMLFVIAPMPAGARCAAHANSENGTAELIRPISAIFGQCSARNAPRSAQRNGSSASAPNASRSSTSGIAPRSLAAIRMNRKDDPQIAPSSASCSGTDQARANARGAPARYSSERVATAGT
jgi:hypothetical protein